MHWDDNETYLEAMLSGKCQYVKELKTRFLRNFVIHYIIFPHRLYHFCDVAAGLEVVCFISEVDARSWASWVAVLELISLALLGGVSSSVMGSISCLHSLSPAKIAARGFNGCWINKNTVYIFKWIWIHSFNFPLRKWMKKSKKSCDYWDWSP